MNPMCRLAYPVLVNAALIMLGLLSSFQAARAEQILIADPLQIERSSEVVKRMTREALAAQNKQAPGAAATQLNGQYQEALEQSLSRLRKQLPKVVAEIAIAQKADAVIEPKTALALKLTGPDISALVTQKLDLQLQSLKFIAP